MTSDKFGDLSESILRICPVRAPGRLYFEPRERRFDLIWSGLI
jgi:hypothetical protein